MYRGIIKMKLARNEVLGQCQSVCVCINHNHKRIILLYKYGMYDTLCWVCVCVSVCALESSCVMCSLRERKSELESKLFWPRIHSIHHQPSSSSSSISQQQIHFSFARILQFIRLFGRLAVRSDSKNHEKHNTSGNFFFVFRRLGYLRLEKRKQYFFIFYEFNFFFYGSTVVNITHTI